MTDIQRILMQHYLFDIGCDHDAETDTPVCVCMEMPRKTFKSIGEAVEYWAEHATQQLLAQRPPVLERSKQWRELADDYDSEANVALCDALRAAADACDQLQGGLPNHWRQMAADIDDLKQSLETMTGYYDKERVENAALRELLATARIELTRIESLVQHRAPDVGDIAHATIAAIDEAIKKTS